MHCQRCQQGILIAGLPAFAVAAAAAVADGGVQECTGAGVACLPVVRGAVLGWGTPAEETSQKRQASPAKLHCCTQTSVCLWFKLSDEIC